VLGRVASVDRKVSRYQWGIFGAIGALPWNFAPVDTAKVEAFLHCCKQRNANGRASKGERTEGKGTKREKEKLCEQNVNQWQQKKIESFQGCLELAWLILK